MEDVSTFLMPECSLTWVASDMLCCCCCVVLSNHVSEKSQTGEWRGIFRQLFVDSMACDSKVETSPLVNMGFLLVLAF
jgi:hypothetical protein